MADQSWLSLFGAAFGGGFTVKLLDIGYQEYRTWKTRHTEDTKTIDERLEPLLRAADELVGKLRSLTEQDFIPIRDADTETMGNYILDATGARCWMKRDRPARKLPRR